jgi:hypothetical protein
MISFALILMTLPSRVAAARARHGESSAGQPASPLTPSDRLSVTSNDGLSGSVSRGTQKKEN